MAVERKGRGLAPAADAGGLGIAVGEVGEDELVHGAGREAAEEGPTAALGPVRGGEAQHGAGRGADHEEGPIGGEEGRHHLTGKGGVEVVVWR